MFQNKGKGNVSYHEKVLDWLFASAFFGMSRPYDPHIPLLPCELRLGSPVSDQ